jgi:hypothetical protein
MPRYSFDLRDGNDLIKDEEGLDLADFDRSQKHAVRALAEIAREEGLGTFEKGDIRNLEIEIRDSNGPVMFARLKLDSKRLH